MTPGEMLCHLRDTFELFLGARPGKPRHPPLWSRTELKWIALDGPFRWPHSVRTMREIDPKRDGSRPADLAADRASLEVALRRFVAEAPRITAEHPIFGPLDERRWLRWGWRHVDHHLRQFWV